MIRATRTQWIKFAVVLALYLIFLVWLRSWLGLVVVPFIFDAYITKKIPWTWWRESKNRHVVTVMGWWMLLYSHWWRYTLSTSISSRTM